jgi:hypothetical protein
VMFALLILSVIYPGLQSLFHVFHYSPVQIGGWYLPLILLWIVLTLIPTMFKHSRGSGLSLLLCRLWPIAFAGLLIIGTLWSLQYKLSALLLCLLFFINVYLWLKTYLVDWLGDVKSLVSSEENVQASEMRKRVMRFAQEKLELAFGYTIQPYEPNTSPDGYSYDRPQETYDHVVLIGHSLGSVILYDALCQYFSRLDEITVGSVPVGTTYLDLRNRIHNRLRLFLTFGSPLDLIKFFFEQGASYSPLFDGLRLLWMQTVGHAIHSRQLFLNTPWLNLWVRSDIISSRLKHYGKSIEENNHLLPNRLTQRHIDSLLVPPLICHSLYLRNKETLRCIADAIKNTCSL